MKYYLSSYQLGNDVATLKRLALSSKMGYIANALDFTGADPLRRTAHIDNDMLSLEKLGLSVVELDLKDYFSNQEKLLEDLDNFGSVFISGGNVFVLRQAMRLSGFDESLNKLKGTDFLYAGYSAAGCVLAPFLKAYQVVDKPHTPYELCSQVIWEGLGHVDFALMPHWDSDHPESADIQKEIAYCESNNIPYKAIRDGDVIVIE